MIKLLTGELEPDAGSGEVWKHPNSRVAYVAQHALKHIENHPTAHPDAEALTNYFNLVDGTSNRISTRQDVSFQVSSGILQGVPASSSRLP
jgi:hypothetical protein